MGRTIPSFRNALEIEKEEWKPFRNALDKSDRKEFDEMWDIPKWYVSACSNSVQYVRLQFWCCRCCTWWWRSRRRSVKVCRSVPATVKTPKDIPLLVIMQRYRTMRTTSRKVVVIIRIIFSSSNNIDVISTPIGFVFAKKWHIILLSIHQPELTRQF